MVDYEGHGYVTLKELDATTQDPVFREHAGDHTQEAIEGSMKKKPDVDYGFGRKQELPATRSAEALAGSRRTLGASVTLWSRNTATWSERGGSW